ncbi:MAG: hypothetical protein HY824_16915 [Acidobacteria bacterium]|nr:hypothetical protein [Acidobacteriota bacterium]
MCAVVLAAGIAVPRAAGQRPDGAGLDLTAALVNIGQRVEAWYSRAQSIVSRETVSIQPLRADLSPGASPRRLAYELRVAWDPSRPGPLGTPDVSVVRQPIRAGRGKPGRDEDPGCMDPKPVSPEPLAMFRPSRLAESAFSLAGTTRVNGRAALLIDYRGVAARPPAISWTKDCVTVELDGRSRGRLWVETATYDVLRIDDRLAAPFEFDVPREYMRRGAAPTMVVERAETSIRYARVQFQDPEESIMLPVSIDSLTVMRGTGVQRVRISQRLSDHRRFLTEGRILD